MLLVSFGFLLLVVGIFFLFEQLGYGVPCIFHTLTGFYCPGCGLTRAASSLINLNIIDALHNNLLIIFLPFLIIYVVISIIEYLKIGIFKFIKIPNNITYIILFLILFFGIIRNVSGFEFLLPIK